MLTVESCARIKIMRTIKFDTLKFVEHLEKAGATRELASAMAEAQKETFSEALNNNLATKSDFLQLSSAIDRRVDSIDAKVDKLTWMMGVFVAVATANFAKQFF